MAASAFVAIQISARHTANPRYFNLVGQLVLAGCVGFERAVDEIQRASGSGKWDSISTHLLPLRLPQKIKACSNQECDLRVYKNTPTISCGGV
jgi:hypothetical protein